MQRPFLTIEEQAIDRLNLQIVKLQQEKDFLRSQLQAYVQEVATHANYLTNMMNNTQRILDVK